jgi:GT2 family glycosyltransferase
MLTRELFNQVGGFDERFPVCEDYDLWLRIAKNHPVPLIADPLVIKRGGHADQLSRSIWGLDRYRVMALQKLLRSELGGPQRQAAVRVLRRKVAVLAAGARKRGKAQDAVSYENILAEFDQGRSVGNGNSRIRDGQGNSAGDVGALA